MRDRTLRCPGFVSQVSREETSLSLFSDIGKETHRVDWRFACLYFGPKVRPSNLEASLEFLLAPTDPTAIRATAGSAAVRLTAASYKKIRRALLATG